jgi:hypothetical protein
MGKVEQAEPTYTHYGSIRGVVEQWQSAINDRLHLSHGHKIKSDQ